MDRIRICVGGVALLAATLIANGCQRAAIDLILEECDGAWCNGPGDAGSIGGGDHANGDNRSGDGATGDHAGGDDAGDARRGDHAAWECVEPKDCTSPSICEETSGAACTNHQCVYTPLPVTESCDDNDQCTEDDHCDGEGSCVADPLECGPLPDPECVAGDTVYRTYSGSGVCDPATGDCYAHHDLPCLDCTAQCLAVCDSQLCSPQNGGCRINGSCVPTLPGFICDHYSNAADGVICDRTGAGSGDGRCLDGECLFCSDHSHCPVCRGCSDEGECILHLPDDPDCGTVSCDAYDRICRDYLGLTSHRCEAGTCRTDPTEDECVIWGSVNNASSTQQCEADEPPCDPPDYCDDNGTCAESRPLPPGTDCGECRECGGGGCEIVSDDGDCGTISCDAHDRTCRNFHGMTSQRCHAGSCTSNPSELQCTQFGSYTDASSTTDCALCKECNGAGYCVAANDDPSCGIILCEGLEPTYPCRDYHNFSGSRCEGAYDCKDHNTVDDCADHWDNRNLSCDDGDACTSGDWCTNGECRATACSPDSCNAGACCTALGHEWFVDWNAGFTGENGNCCGDDTTESYNRQLRWEVGWSGLEVQFGPYGCCANGNQCVDGTSAANAGCRSQTTLWTHGGEPFLCYAGDWYVCGRYVTCRVLSYTPANNRICDRTGETSYAWQSTAATTDRSARQAESYLASDHPWSPADAIEGPYYACCDSADQCVDTASACRAEEDQVNAWLCCEGAWWQCDAGVATTKCGYQCNTTINRWQDCGGSC